MGFFYSLVRCYYMLQKLYYLALGLIFSQIAPADEIEVLKWFNGPLNSFSIMAPTTWSEVISKPELFQVLGPNDIGSLSGAAYKFNSSTNLSIFSNARFAGVMKHYKQVAADAHITADGTEIVIRQYEGTWPGESKLTSYVVACATNGEIYVSVSLTMDKSDFVKKKIVYLKIFETLRVGKST